ncbi:Sec-independent protein translocase protein TatB [Acinetobacter sp.]|uniref:Sec-independent protein translocase protein TatB n=1 Tax=Acinetobacter sp. TaxID=472 RepID=UPI00388F6EDE
MLNIGMTELLAFGIISLLVLGPDKLPEAARFTGKWYAKIKRMISNVQNNIDRELRLSELREQMQNEMQRIQELEQKIHTQMHELKQQSQPAPEKQLQNAVPTNKNFSTFYNFINHHQPLCILSIQSTCSITPPTEQPLNHMYAISELNELKVAI